MVSVMLALFRHNKIAGAAILVSRKHSVYSSIYPIKVSGPYVETSCVFCFLFYKKYHKC